MPRNILISVFSSFVAVNARLVKNERLDEINLRHSHASSGRNLKETFCSAPITKGKVNFPDKYIGRAKVNYDMYSGYVNVSNAPDYLYYWFFSTQDKQSNAPLIVWTNGGPGCSAMEGATTENSPLWLFNVKEACSNNPDCDYTLDFSQNVYGWNKHANLLYVDQPRNVGNSFGYGTKGVANSQEAAADFIVFLNGWYDLFPEFVGRKLIIAGESYGGHYVPAWSAAILSYNQNSANTRKINYVGMIIGNGLISNSIQNTNTYVQFQHQENLIPSTSNPQNTASANSAMNSYLGYTPNYYDYRLQSISCKQGCYGYNYSAWSNFFLRSDVKTAMNVCGDAGVDAFTNPAGGCINMGSFDSPDNFNYPAAVGNALDAGVAVTFYYGKCDTACPYVGGMAVAKAVPWSGSAGFNSAPLVSVQIEQGVEIGQQQKYGKFTFLQFESSGHMVPADQPSAAYYAINTVLTAI